MLGQRADDLVELSAAEQVDGTPVAEVGIDPLEPLARSGFTEDSLRLGEDELESVQPRRVRAIGSASAGPARYRAALHSEDRGESRLPPEVARQRFDLDFR